MRDIKNIFVCLNLVNKFVLNGMGVSEWVELISYPSTRNLKILYHRLGIEDIVTELNRKSKRDIKTGIDSFLSLRESIAHQGAPGITLSDIERHYMNISEVVNYIDRIVYSHIRKESGHKF